MPTVADASAVPRRLLPGEGGGAVGGRRLRVLHCPAAVGGHAPNLARAERRVGLESWAVAFDGNAYGYVVDEIVPIDGVRFRTQQWRYWSLLLRAWRDHDVVHYNFGSQILPHAWGAASAGDPVRAAFHTGYARLCRWAERALLRRKVVAVTFQGDDARQGDYCRRHFALSIAQEVDAAYYTAGTDELKRRRIAWFDRVADLIYALNPDLLRVLPARAEFLPYASVDLEEWTPAPPPPRGAPVVVHAPSLRAAKGTAYVVDAMHRLRAAGIAAELVLVENLPNHEARRLYARAHLVVDQLLAGWYGGFAVEAMALGKPVVAYIRPEDLAYVPPAMRTELPVITATPDSIYAVLKEWLTSRAGALAAHGARSRRYVEQWHDPLRIATRLAQDYQRVAVTKRARRRGGP